jgi:alcohol dehydrogenase class IV
MTTAGNYELTFPSQVRFGWGVRSHLAEALRFAVPGKSEIRLFVIASRTFSATDPVIAADITTDRGCVVCGRFTGVPHDPPLSTVDDLISRLRASQADAVLAVGGGSVIDAAKAAAALAPIAGATVSPYFHGELAIPCRGLPFIAMPTTAGTGAEITRNAVLTDPEAALKTSLRSPYLVPTVAVIDPELTVSLPPAETAASGLDALTQAIESYLSIGANAVSSALAKQAVVYLMNGLPDAYRDGANRTARGQAAEGSMLGALAFAQSGLGAVHGLAHPLGALLGLPHGVVCAILLPHILAWNAPACIRRCETLAKALGLNTADNLVMAVSELCGNLNVPAGLREFGLKKSQFNHIVKHCRSGSMKCNPRPMSDGDVRQLLTRLANQ